MSDSGFLIPYGVTTDDIDRPIHINSLNPDEHRGLNCGLVCIECGQRLIARFPKTNPEFKPHFAHYTNVSCSISVESLIHRMAKKTIQDEMVMCFPELTVMYKGYEEIAFKKQRITFDTVALESKRTTEDGLSFIPDVVGFYNGVEVFIEIKNTHAVDMDKHNKIVSYGASAIELDISSIDDVFDESDLKKAVLTSIHNKKWLYLPQKDRVYEKLKAHVDDIERVEADRLRARNEARRLRQIEYEEEQEKQRQQRRLARIESRKNTQIKHSTYDEIAFYQNEFNAAKWKREMELSLPNHSRYRYLNIDREDDIFTDIDAYSMNCHYKIWQAYLFDVFIQPGVVIQVKTLVDELRQEFRRDVNWKLAYLDKNKIEPKDRIGIYDLTDIVYMYFKSLDDKGYVVEHGWSGHRYYSKFKVL